MPQRRDYFLDQTNENTRLRRQHELMKTATGWLVPPEIDPDAVHDVLDLACGPGSWALDFARAYPCARVVGVDRAKIALVEARRLAARENLSNVEFQEVDILGEAGLPFPDSRFDLVWARALFLHLPVATWEPLLHEVYRVLRPNGAFVALDNDGMSGSTTNEAYRRLNELLTELLIQNGGMPRFGPLSPGILRRVGFERLWMRPHYQALSSQVGDRPVCLETQRAWSNALNALYNARTAIVEAGLTTVEEFNRLFEEACRVFEEDPDQVTIELAFMVSGRKRPDAASRARIAWHRAGPI